MAHVEWSAGIDSVSGALSKPGNNPQHSCNKMLLGTHRIAPTQSNQCNRIYLRKKVKRSTPVTSKEIGIRSRFAAISRAVAERKEDLSKLSADQAAFVAQKDLPNGKKTMLAWYWMVCGQEYDQQNG